MEEPTAGSGEQQLTGGEGAGSAATQTAPAEFDVHTGEDGELLVTGEGISEPVEEKPSTTPLNDQGQSFLDGGRAPLKEMPDDAARLFAYASQEKLGLDEIRQLIGGNSAENQPAPAPQADPQAESLTSARKAATTRAQTLNGEIDALQEQIDAAAEEADFATVSKLNAQIRTKDREVMKAEIAADQFGRDLEDYEQDQTAQQERLEYEQQEQAINSAQDASAAKAAQLFPQIEQQDSQMASAFNARWELLDNSNDPLLDSPNAPEIVAALVASEIGTPPSTYQQETAPTGRQSPFGQPTTASPTSGGRAPAGAVPIANIDVSKLAPDQFEKVWDMA